MIAGPPAPLVSIVTPSFNQGQYISDAIRSVLDQDYPRVEYFVVDGASADRTVGVLRRHEGRLRWVSESDAGQAAAINKGFRLTSGEILGWLNADDTYEPGAVSAAVAHLIDHPEVMLVYGDARFVDAEGRPLGPCPQIRPFDRRRLVHDGDFIVQPAAFFRRSAFEAVGGLDETLHYALDYDLWLKLARFPVVYLPRRLAAYRLTGENKTLRGGLARLAELERIGHRHGAGGLPAAFRIEKLGFCRREAWAAARKGRLLAAAALIASGSGAVLSSHRALALCLRLLLSRPKDAARGRRFDNLRKPP